MSDPKKQETNNQPDNSGNSLIPDVPGGAAHDRAETEKRTNKPEQIKGNGSNHSFLGLTVYELANIILLVLLVIVNYEYTAYAGKQWQTMESQLRTYYAQLLVARDTLNQMKTSSASSSTQTGQIIDQASHISGALATSNQQNLNSFKASLGKADESLGFTVGNARLEQRAWLGIGQFHIDQFEKGKSFKAEMDVFNSGKTPALNVEEGGKFDITLLKLLGPPSDTTTGILFSPAQSVPPQGHFTFHMEVPQEQMTIYDERLRNQQAFLYLFGEFHYVDISRTFSGVTQYCMNLTVPTSGPPELIFCNTYNDMK